MSRNKKKGNDMIKHKTDGKLNILHRMDRVIFHLSREVAVRKGNPSRVLEKWVPCCAVLNQWTYTRNENEAWIILDEGGSGKI